MISCMILFVPVDNQELNCYIALINIKGIYDLTETGLMSGQDIEEK